MSLILIGLELTVGTVNLKWWPLITVKNLSAKNVIKNIFRRFVAFQSKLFPDKVWDAPNKFFFNERGIQNKSHVPWLSILDCQSYQPIRVQGWSIKSHVFGPTSKVLNDLYSVNTWKNEWTTESIFTFSFVVFLWLQLCTSDSRF